MKSYSDFKMIHVYHNHMIYLLEYTQNFELIYISLNLETFVG